MTVYIRFDLVKNPTLLAALCPRITGTVVEGDATYLDAQLDQPRLQVFPAGTLPTRQAEPVETPTPHSAEPPTIRGEYEVLAVWVDDALGDEIVRLKDVATGEERETRLLEGMRDKSYADVFAAGKPNRTYNPPQPSRYEKILSGG